MEENYEKGGLAIGVVVNVKPSYAIMMFPSGWSGLIHISELSRNYVRNIGGFIHLGGIYKAKILEVDAEKKEMRLSLKQVTAQEKKAKLTRVPPLTGNGKAILLNLPRWIKEYEEQEKGLENA